MASMSRCPICRFDLAPFPLPDDDDRRSAAETNKSRTIRRWSRGRRMRRTRAENGGVVAVAGGPTAPSTQAVRSAPEEETAAEVAGSSNGVDYWRNRHRYRRRRLPLPPEAREPLAAASESFGPASPPVPAATRESGAAAANERAAGRTRGNETQEGAADTSSIRPARRRPVGTESARIVPSDPASRRPKETACSWPPQNSRSKRLAAFDVAAPPSRPRDREDAREGGRWLDLFVLHAIADVGRPPASLRSTSTAASGGSTGFVERERRRTFRVNRFWNVVILFILLIQFAANFAVATVDPDSNNPWSYYDSLRSTDSATPLDASATVVRVPSDSGTQRAETVHLRHMSQFGPLVSFGRRDVPDPNYFDRPAAALLAVRHFNEGVGDVIQQIGDESIGVHSCPDLKFTLDVFDTQWSPLTAAGILSDELLSRRLLNDPTQPTPTGLLGAARSAVSMPLATLSGVNSIPQVSYSSMSTKFDDLKENYPLFGRLVPSTSGAAYAAVEYWSNMGVTHAGVLFLSDDEYAKGYAFALQTAAQNHAHPPIDVVLASFPLAAAEEDVVDAVQLLKESGCRYFMGVLYKRHFIPVMSEAAERGIAGPGYFWMFGDSTGGIGTYEFPADSPAARAAGGAALLTIADPSIRVGKRGHDAFMERWKREVPTPEFRSYFRSKMPSHIVNATEGPLLTDHVLNDMPSPYVFLMYDSVIAMALSACRLHRQNVEFTGPELYRSFLDSKFEGAYGAVEIDERTGTRRFQTVPYSMSNVIPLSEAGVRGGDGDGGGFVSFAIRATDVYDNSRWTTLPNATFLYSDGSAVAPDVLPPLDENANEISENVRATGLALCAATLCLSLFFGLWTHRNRHSKVIKASQPGFLQMICLGTFVMGTTIVPLSFQGDDEALSEAERIAVCMSTVWLFSVGFVVAFSALFSKMRRINQIFYSNSHSRVIVKARDVIIPFVCLLLVNIVILVAWTIASPLRLDRIETGAIDRFGRSTESYTTCIGSELSGLDFTFWTLWIVTNLLALIYANYEAYRARKISIQYSESQYIGITMACMLQVLVVALPTVIAVMDSPSPRFIILSIVVAVTCVVILLPLFLPKVLFLRQWKKEKAEKERRRAEKKKRNREFQARTEAAAEALPKTEPVGDHPSNIRTDYIATDGTGPALSNGSNGAENYPLVGTRSIMVGIRKVLRIPKQDDYVDEFSENDETNLSSMEMKSTHHMGLRFESEVVLGDANHVETKTELSRLKNENVRLTQKQELAKQELDALRRRSLPTMSNRHLRHMSDHSTSWS